MLLRMWRLPGEMLSSCDSSDEGGDGHRRWVTSSVTSSHNQRQGWCRRQHLILHLLLVFSIISGAPITTAASRAHQHHLRRLLVDDPPVRYGLDPTDDYVEPSRWSRDAAGNTYDGPPTSGWHPNAAAFGPHDIYARRRLLDHVSSPVAARGISTNKKPAGYVGRTASKRRSVLGLDNVDFAASMLDMARTQGARPSASGGSGLTAEDDDIGGSSPYGSARDGLEMGTQPSSSVGGGGGNVGVHNPLGRLRISHHSTSSTMIVPGSPSKSNRGRLSLNVSPQDLRKMMDIINAGRRR
jgi:hypothetical protein